MNFIRFHVFLLTIAPALQVQVCCQDIMFVSYHFCDLYNFVKGFAISTTTTDVENFEWMKTEVEYTCDDGKSVFYSEELNYTSSFTLSCEKDLIFGGKFPYWQIPDTEYPKKTEIICALPTKCYNFIDVDPQLKELGLSETFDRISIQNEDTFEYFCPNETRGNASKLTFTYLTSFIHSI